MYTLTARWQTHLVAAFVVGALLLCVGLLTAQRAEATTKWFPGHYVRQLSDKPLTNTDSFLRLSDTTGVQYQLSWGELEGAKGQYDFSKIDQMLALANQHGKKVMLLIEDRDFGGNMSGNMPAYVTQAGCVYPLANGGGLKWWVPTCVDHFIDLFEALARYNCNNTLAAIAVTGESALAERTTQPGYSDEAYITQYIRATQEVKRLFPNTLVLTGFNFLPKDGLARVAAAVEQLGGSGLMHPDSTPGEYMGDATALEIQYAARGVPTFAGFQEAQITNAVTNPMLLDWAVNTIKAPAWVWNHYRANYTQYFGDLLVYLQTSAARTLAQKNAACPSRLAPCVTTLSSCSSTYTPPPLTPVTPVSATCQNIQTPTVAIPQGYGAAYNPLSSTKEYLVSAACTSATQANVTVGNGNTTTYVYNKGYYYTGTTWQQFTLSCSNLVSNTWCVGRGTVTIPTPQNPTNVIGYTCQWVNNAWKCGCRDNTCNARFWQLQRVGR